MQRCIDFYCRCLDALSALLLLAIVVLVFGNVVLRYGFNSGILISEELSRWFFVWLTFLGAIVALRERAHLGTDLLVRRLGRHGRMACMTLAYAIMIYVTWLLTDGSLTQARLNVDVLAPVSSTPVAVFYAAGVVFGLSALAILGWQLLCMLSGRVSTEDLIAVRESEDEPHAPVHRGNE
ncbi:MAG: TRAP transporter small permease [Burkholderiales bacterium]|jgi:TRAP-type C4-dicarboxylate transport system permease small subunit|nr:TRAP transporter small permease [Burkholderiales bacterium]